MHPISQRIFTDSFLLQPVIGSCALVYWVPDDGSHCRTRPTGSYLRCSRLTFNLSLDIFCGRSLPFVAGFLVPDSRSPHKKCDIARSHHFIGMSMKTEGLSKKFSIPPEKRLLYLAILLGILAFLFHFIALRVSSTKNQVAFVAAARQIRYGEVIQREDLDTVIVMASKGLSRTYLRLRDFMSKKQTIAQRTISKGELLSEATLGERAFDFDLKTLGPDERLVAVPVDDESSVGYRIHIGDRIDIYPNVLGQNPEPLLTAVEVVALGSEAQTRSRGAQPTVSLG